MASNTVSFTAAAAFAAAFSLTACSGGSQEEAAAQNNQAEKAEPATANLPPSIQASRVYRCGDNSLVYVDFFTDNTAAIRTEELGAPTKLAPTNGAGPFTAEGYSVAANEPSTSITLPGKSAQTCRARS
jgi:hypothetical protein